MLQHNTAFGSATAQLIRAIAGLLAVVMLFQAPAYAADNPSPTAPPLTITTSIKPLQMIAQAVLTDSAHIVRIVPDGADPHDYVLRPSDAEKAVQGQLLIWLGPLAEPYLAQLANRPGVSQLDLSQLTQLTLLPQRRLVEWDENSHEHNAAPFDQHFWLDPNNAAAIAQSIALQVGTRDPIHAKQFAANADKFSQTVSARLPLWQATIAANKSHYFIAYHDAYQYLEKIFGLNVATVLTLEPEIKPGARHLLKVKAAVSEKNVRCFVTEPSYDPRLLEKVMPEGAKQIMLDAHGSGIAISNESYFEWMDNLINALNHCLAKN